MLKLNDATLHLLRHRSVLLGYVGGELVLLGVFFHGTIIGFALVEVPLVESGGDRDQMIAFANQMYEGTAFTMILFSFLSFFVGWIFLAIALWRAWGAPLWVAATLAAAPLSEFFGSEALSPALMFGLFLVAFGYFGKMLCLSDKERAGHRVSRESRMWVGWRAWASPGKAEGVGE